MREISPTRPIVNLSYPDPSVLRVAKPARMGSLRYPGGSTANSWNLSSGRIRSIKDSCGQRHIKTNLA